MGKVRVVLAEDHVVVRKGLALLIDAQPDMEVVGEADDGGGAIDLACACLPDLIIMDITMPHMNGTQATARLRQTLPELKVVVLSRHDQMEYVQKLLHAGAHAYVLKQSDPIELLRAIRTVMAGNTYLDSFFGNQIFNLLGPRSAGLAAPASVDLSERELEVVRLLALGHSNKEIAAQLNLSVKTVESYKARATMKLDLHSRADLVQYAIQHGWFENV